MTLAMFLPAFLHQNSGPSSSTVTRTTCQSADAIIDRATTDGKLYPGIHREMLLNTTCRFQAARPSPSASLT